MLRPSPLPPPPDFARARRETRRVFAFLILALSLLFFALIPFSIMPGNPQSNEVRQIPCTKETADRFLNSFAVTQSEMFVWDEFAAADAVAMEVIFNAFPELRAKYPELVREIEKGKR